jgi:hypothetical protein
MTPLTYWIGWIAMFIAWVISVVLACWYIGNKIERLIKCMTQYY